MKELVSRLKQQAGLTDEQAMKAIEVMKTFAKEEFPIFSGAIDKLFDKYSAAAKDDFLD